MKKNKKLPELDKKTFICPYPNCETLATQEWANWNLYLELIFNFSCDAGRFGINFDKQHIIIDIIEDLRKLLKKKTYLIY